MKTKLIIIFALFSHLLSSQTGGYFESYDFMVDLVVKQYDFIISPGDIESDLQLAKMTYPVDSLIIRGDTLEVLTKFAELFSKREKNWVEYTRVLEDIIHAFENESTFIIGRGAGEGSISPDHTIIVGDWLGRDLIVHADKFVLIDWRYLQKLKAGINE